MNSTKGNAAGGAALQNTLDHSTHDFTSRLVQIAINAGLPTAQIFELLNPPPATEGDCKLCGAAFSESAPAASYSQQIRGGDRGVVFTRYVVCRDCSDSDTRAGARLSALVEADNLANFTLIQSGGGNA